MKMPHFCVYKLPQFRDYTVDERLKQFRRLLEGRRIEFVDFDSPKGKKLLRAYRLFQLLETRAKLMNER